MRHPVRLAALFVVAALALPPAAALAQSPPPPGDDGAGAPATGSGPGAGTGGGPGTTEPPPPAPPPAPGTLSLRVESVSLERGRAYAIAGQRWRVRGSVRPYVAGQRVVVRFSRDGRKIRAVAVRILRGTDGNGRFALGFASAKRGDVRIDAVHEATAEQVAMRAGQRRVRVLADSAGPGSSGVLVRLLQRSLAGLRYAVPSDGRYGDGTARAVLAFRKVNGMPRTLVADRAVLLRALSGRGAFRPRFPGHGRHIEGDLSRQVLALIGAGGRLERVYTTSSGKPSTPTVRGSFRFYMKTPGSNAKGMYYSSYFIRGYAVHGYAEVPPYPASHGCLRVPIPDAVSIYDWIRVGDRIDVYA